VETEAQRQVLAALGCEEFQGYLLSRPVPESALMQLLADTPPLAALMPTAPPLPGREDRAVHGVRGALR
jgi:predicted signal transduction protein with EAL and GGDEF domain